MRRVTETFRNILLEMGKRPEGGFWETNFNNGALELNSQAYRGRFFASVSSCDPLIAKLCQQNLKIAKEVDPTLKVVDAASQPVGPTHLIALLYQTLALPPQAGYIPWHQDNGENDGEAGFPVISISLGETCDFLINHKKPRGTLSNPSNLAHRVKLKSGDIIIFGNNESKCRHIWHAIYTIENGTAPEFLSFLKGYRLNATLRHTPQLYGREDEFKTVHANILKQMPQNPFYDVSLMRKQD